MTKLDFNEMAALLAASETHKVLRKLDPGAYPHRISSYWDGDTLPGGWPVELAESFTASLSDEAKALAHNLSRQPFDPDTRIGILLDVETTGLSPQRDTIIQLAMVPFRYDGAGRVVQVLSAFNGYQEPSKPLSPLVSVLTGLTDEFLAGQSIDPTTVADFVSKAAIVICHNAKFDRAFVEKQFPDAFAGMPFACSMSQIPWAEYGFEGTKLSYLCQQSGFYFDGHDAQNDCHATIELLSMTLPGTDRTALDVLLDNAVSPTVRIYAENAPFEKKEILKERGYRWQGEAAGKIRAWYIDLAPDAMEPELQFLRREIIKCEPTTSEITALDRFSDRI